MKTIRSVDANRHFFWVMKQVSQGEEFLVVSRGKPVAIISSVRKADSSRLAAREMLFERLRSQETTGILTWSRDELYERTP